MGMQELRDRGGGLIKLLQAQLQLGLYRQETCPLRILSFCTFDMLDGRHELLPLHHAVDFLPLSGQVGTTEFEFLARSAGTRSISIKSHIRTIQNLRIKGKKN